MTMFTLRHSSLDIGGSQIVETFTNAQRAEADRKRDLFSAQDHGTDSQWYVIDEDGE